MHKYSDNDLLLILETFYEQHGRTPMIKDLKQGDTIRKRFGGWDKALELAGLPINKKGGYSDRELLSILQTFYKQHGKAPRIMDIEQGQTIIRRFDGWNKALKLAGLPINKGELQYSDRELLSILQTFYKRHGKTPRIMDIEQGQTIIHRFDGWNKALKLAGLPGENKRGPKKEYSDNDYLSLLKSFYTLNGRTPRCCDIKQSQTIIKRFDGWNKALELADLPINKHNYKNTSDEYFLFILQDFYNKYGRAPRIQDIQMSNKMIERFGCWNKALKLARLPLGRTGRKPYSDSELLTILQTFYNQNNRYPRAKEIKQYYTILKRFGGWNKALDLAGLTSTSNHSSY